MEWGNRTLGDARKTLREYQRRIHARIADGKPLYIDIDANLGWRLQPDCRHPSWPYATDSFGNRRSWDESSSPSKSAFRVAIAGNSHVHGDESSDDETWVWQTQQCLGPSFCVRNLGVTAYSTDQAFLRLQDFAETEKPDLAVLALTTTDVFRNLNLCRAFIMNDFELPLCKPRFAMDGAGLRLLKPPPLCLETLPGILDDPEIRAYLRTYDYFYPTITRQGREILRRFRAPVKNKWELFLDDGVNTTFRICQLFTRWCRERDIVPTVMILPVYWGLFAAGREFTLLAQMLGEERFHLIDARTVFTPERRALPREKLHYRYNHYLREVGSWIADHVSRRIGEISR